MERKERRHHTREFKLEAVRLAAVGDKTKAKVARELGVRVNQLRQWRLDFEEEERNGVPKQELATAEHDLGTLRRENARLREENEILKKAATTGPHSSRAGSENSFPSRDFREKAGATFPATIFVMVPSKPIQRLSRRKIPIP